jgi:uncharacterized FlaG/YvyC family protein
MGQLTIHCLQTQYTQQPPSPMQYDFRRTGQSFQSHSHHVRTKPDASQEKNFQEDRNQPLREELNQQHITNREEELSHRVSQLEKQLSESSRKVNEETLFTFNQIRE